MGTRISPNRRRLTSPSSTTNATPACQPISERKPKKNIGARIAPTANEPCSRLVAAGLPPESRLTMRLSKLVTLPRPMPVKINATISQTGLPHKSIIKKPKNAKEDSSTMERRCPRYSGIRPLMKPATRLPAECAERNTPLSVSLRP